MNDRQPRSNHYQWLLLECPCSPEVLTEYSDGQGTAGILNKIHNEELVELWDKLLTAFWRIVNTQLTSRQKQVLKLCADGLTQTEIAKILDVNQSSITKSINGNCDYRKGKRIYGGSKRRILKLAEKDPEIQGIFKRMRELQEE